MGFIGARVDVQKLGYNIHAVLPRNGCPSEEIFFVLRGSGAMRMGKKICPQHNGDFIASPPGGPDRAYKITTTGSKELRQVLVSRRLSPGVDDSANSGKFGSLVELPSDTDGKPRRFTYVGRGDQSLKYWEGA